MSKRKKHINTVKSALSGTALRELVRTTEELLGNGVVVRDRKMKPIGERSVMVKAEIVVDLKLLSKPTRKQIKQHIRGRCGA